jgi:hypothetical protein
MDEYTKFVVMTEDALVTKNTAKMKWLGLESRRQAIQHEMIYLESAIQNWRKHRTPIHRELCDEYESSIKANLKQMKDVIVELRLNTMLQEQINCITRRTSATILQALMEEEVYAHYSSGEPIENLSFPQKKALHAKLKIALDELI